MSRIEHPGTGNRRHVGPASGPLRTARQPLGRIGVRSGPTPVKAGLLARLVLGVALSAAIAPLAPRPATAIELEVTSSTTLRLEVQERGRRPIARGRLVDNVSQGVRGATVSLALSTADGAIVRSASAATDTLGYYQIELDLPDGTYAVAASFDGRLGYEASAASAEIDVEREALALELDIPRHIHVSSRGLNAELRADALVPFPPDTAIPGQLVVGSDPGAERRELELVRAQTQGVAHVRAYQGDGGFPAVALVSLPADSLPLGDVPIVLEIAETSLYEGANAAAMTTVLVQPTLAFRAEVVRERDRRGVNVTGSIKAAHGPLTDARIAIEVMETKDNWRSVGDLESRTDGTFAGFVPLESLPTGTVTLRGVFVPDLGDSLRSEPLRLEVDDTGASGWLVWVLIAFFALVVGALVAVYAFQVVRAWWKNRKFATAPVTQGTAVTVTAVAPPDGAADVRETDLAGFVWDAEKDAGVPGARVIVVATGGPLDAPSAASTDADARGYFALLGLPNGRHRVWGSAHGYVSGHFDAAMPHRGEYRCVRFPLVSVRARIRDIYVWLLDRYSPDEPVWGHTTPQEVERTVAGDLREIVERTRVGLPDAVIQRASEALESASLPALFEVTTRILEEVYYSERVFDESLVPIVERLASGLQPLLARRAAPLPDPNPAAPLLGRPL